MIYSSRTAALFLVITLGLSGCLETTQTSFLSSVASTFKGATSAVNQASGVEILLSWATPPSGTSQIKVFSYNQSGGSLTPLISLPGTATSWSQGGLTSGTLYSYVVQAFDASGNSDGNMNVVSALAYSGASTAASVGLTTAYVGFGAPGAAATGAHIYCQIRSGSYTLMATVSNPSSTSYQLTSLLSGTTYTCRVNAILAINGLDDNNTNTETFQTVSQSSTAYGGVVLVQAYGDAPNAPTAATAATASPAITNPVTTPTTRQINITWKNFSISGAASASYRLVRVQYGNTIDMNTSTICTPLVSTACQVCLSTTAGSNTNSRTCSDTLIADSPVQYQYAVTLIVNQSTIPPMAEEMPNSGSSPYLIFVPVPPANMVLVQRDSANYEMCQLMGLNPDPLNHQRCSYTGQGAVPYNSGPGNPPLSLPTNYYDFGYDLFVDRWEAACNWTPQTSGGMCGAGASSGDCNGNTSGVAPSNSIGVNGNVYYDASGSGCYIKQSGTWLNTLEPGSMSEASLQAIMTNAPNPAAQKPPFTGMIQSYGMIYCQAAQDPNYGSKRLLRRREQVVAGAFQWLPADPNPLSISTIQNLQGGSSQLTTQSCNSLNATGISPTASFNTSNELAVTSSNTWGNTFVIGSDYTAQCVSRYGIQDMVGNLFQWLADTLSDCSSTTHACTSGAVSSVDSGDRDLANINFDGITGPGGTSGGQTSPDYTSEWSFSEPAFNANYFSAPLGLPLVESDGGNALQIGTQITRNNLQLDLFELWSDIANGDGERVANFAGNTGGAGGNGRFLVSFQTSTTFALPYNGLRCAMPAD